MINRLSFMCTLLLCVMTVLAAEGNTQTERRTGGSRTPQDRRSRYDYGDVIGYNGKSGKKLPYTLVRENELQANVRDFAFFRKGEITSGGGKDRH